MKVFAGINGSTDLPEVNDDFNASRKIDRLFIGRLGVYFRDGLKMRFLAYELLERVFIRVQEVNLRTCCGGSTDVYYRLVFVADGGEICNVPSEDGKAMDSALALIHENAPDIAIGFTQE